MIRLQDLIDERNRLNCIIHHNTEKHDNTEELGRQYRRRADININLYLTNHVLDSDNNDFDKLAFNDYEKSIDLLETSNSRYHQAEAILAYGNAIKEQFLPKDKKNNISFREYEEKAKCQYNRCIDITLSIDYLRYYYFTTLEQMNLEIRKKVWEDNRLPKRIAICHSLKSPLSHQYLKGVYYFAYKNLVEVWEYNYGRVPKSDLEERFIWDRFLDASGIVFLCSPEYNKDNQIIKFEIEKTKKLKGIDDSTGVFALDLDNTEVLKDLQDVAIVVKESDFEKQIEDFFKNSLKNVYCCRKKRCNN